MFAKLVAGDNDDTKSVFGEEKSTLSQFSGLLGIKVLVIPEGQFLKPNNYMLEFKDEKSANYVMNIKHKDLTNQDIFRKFSFKVRDHKDIEAEQYYEYCRKPQTKSRKFVDSSITLLNASGIADDFVEYPCEFYESKFLILSLKGWNKLKQDIDEIMNAIQKSKVLEAEILVCKEDVARMEVLFTETNEGNNELEEKNFMLEDNIRDLNSQIESIELEKNSQIEEITLEKDSQINDLSDQNDDVNNQLAEKSREVSQLEVKNHDIQESLDGKNQIITQANAELKAMSDKYNVSSIECKKLNFEDEKKSKIVSEQGAKIAALESENGEQDEQVTVVSNRLKEELENVESWMAKNNEMEEQVDFLRDENNAYTAEYKNLQKSLSTAKQEILETTRLRKSLTTDYKVQEVEYKKICGSLQDLTIKHNELLLEADNKERQVSDFKIKITNYEVMETDFQKLEVDFDTTTTKLNETSQALMTKESDYNIMAVELSRQQKDSRQQKEDINKMSNTINTLEEDLAEYKDQNKAQEQEKIRLELEVQDYEYKLEKETDSAERKNKMNQDIIETKEQKIQDLNSSLQDMTNNYKRSDDEFLKKCDEAKYLKQDQSDANFTVQSQNNDIEQLRKEQSNLDIQLVAMAEEKANLETERFKMEKKNVEGLRRENKLQQSIDSLMKENNNLEAKVQESNAGIRKSDSDLNKKIEELKQFEKNMIESSSEADYLKNDLESKMLKIECLEEEISSLTHVRDGLETKVWTCEKDVQFINQQNQHFRECLDEKDKGYLEQEKRLNDILNLKKETHEELKNREKALKSLEIELKQFKDMKEILDKDVERTQESNQDMSTKLDEKTQELKRIASLKEKNDMEIYEVRQKLDFQEKSTTKYQEDSKNFQKYTETLKNQLKQERQKTHLYENDLNATKQYADGLKNELRSRQITIEDLNFEIESMGTNVTSYETNLKDLKSKEHNMTNFIDNIEKKYKILDKRLKEQESNCTDLEGINKQQTLDMQKMRSSQIHNETQVANASANLTEITQLYNKLENLHETVRGKHNETLVDNLQQNDISHIKVTNTNEDFLFDSQEPLSIKNQLLGEEGDQTIPHNKAFKKNLDNTRIPNKDLDKSSDTLMSPTKPHNNTLISLKNLGDNPIDLNELKDKLANIIEDVYDLFDNTHNHSSSRTMLSKGIADDNIKINNIKELRNDITSSPAPISFGENSIRGSKR